MADSSLRIVFMGTPSFAVPSLRRMCEEGFRPVSVFTQPDRVNGRGKKITFSPVKTFALEHDIPVYQPASMKSEEVLEQIRAMKPDLFVVIAYGRILPEALLNVPPLGAINVHGSLLPKYRGAAPIQRAIIDGEKETGVTIMKLDKGMDTGDMLAKASLPIADDMTAGDLFDTLSVKGADLLIPVLKNIKEYLAKAVPQNEAEATYAEKVTKPMGHLHWEQPASTLSGLIRGLYPDPGSFTFFRKKRVKLHAISGDTSGHSDKEPGTIVSTSDGLITVACGEGLIRISELQPENHKKMKASDFINGYQVKVNDKFEF
jgi:methionyl-tRNA formyltransferase